MTRIPILLALPLLSLLCLLADTADTADARHAGSHQVAADWTPVVARPEFARGEGPVVLVDAAHGNWHTIDGRFAAFAELLAQDGYRVAGADAEISPELLSKADVLVIANAVLGGDDSDWRLPTPHAFTPREVRTLVQWVDAGGALLLIADHMPFPGSVADIADAFGVVFINGYAKRSFDQGGTLDYSISTGSLADHAITRGRNPAEQVKSIRTFTGQGFRFVGPGEPLMFLPDDWAVFLPRDAFKGIDATTASVPARGLLQGGVLKHGDGRVAVFGEAAMFTAQSITRADGRVERFGMNDPAAAGNAQFVLNVTHWLSGLLDSP